MRIVQRSSLKSHIPRGSLFFVNTESCVDYLDQRGWLITPFAASLIVDCWQPEGIYLPANFLDGMNPRKGGFIDSIDLMKYRDVMISWGLIG